MPPRLVVDLSGHGYGHAGMTIPILDALRRARPDVALTIRTTVPRGWIAERLGGPFDWIEEEDFGMAMADAMRVLPRESAAAYRRLHADWPARVAAAAERLAGLRPALLLSNVSYLSLAAARRAGVPALAYSSLNWADVFAHYCGGDPGAASVLRDMREAYAAAELFLQSVPSMAMPSIGNGRPIGPVARLGRDRRAELRRRVGAGIVVLVALGGIPLPLPVGRWPRLPGLRIVLATAATDRHPDVVPLSEVGIPFVDAVRSCDVVVAKTGYGTLAEAACNGAPILHVPRRDWPETASLAVWLKGHARSLELDEATLRSGGFAAAVGAVRALPAVPAPAPTGIAEAVALLLGRLG